MREGDLSVVPARKTMAQDPAIIQPEEHRSCPICGQVNETGLKHCAYCGAVLLAGEDPGTDPGTPESPLVE